MNIYAAVNQVNVVFTPYILICNFTLQKKVSNFHGTFVQWVNAKFALVPLVLIALYLDVTDVFVLSCVVLPSLE